MQSVIWYIIVAVFAILFLWTLLLVIEHQVENDVIYVPAHMSVSEMEQYTSQEVFDWVAYVTKLTGRSYLEQLVFPDDAKHAAMLKDMIECLDANSHEQLMDWLKEVGYHYQLDVSIIDAPY